MLLSFKALEFAYPSDFSYDQRCAPYLAFDVGNIFDSPQIMGTCNALFHFHVFHLIRCLLLAKP